MALARADRIDFNNLFIFEIANNHQGLVAHGLRIIKEIADVVDRARVRGAIKLQFRALDTFIHPDYRDSNENRHIRRFLSTRLREDEFAQLVDAMAKRGLISVCTPFDEPSVDVIERLGIEVIKVGSPSAQDWPLLERVAETGKPVICSTGGLLIRQIDKIVSFFQHRGVRFALMHCVSIYPTPNKQLHLNQIETLRNRYPDVTIGFSTHEGPTNLNAIRVAYAKGARLFEKHVGVPTEEIALNDYSATPAQVEAWLGAWREAIEACGGERERVIPEEETRDLRSLMRGVYAQKDIEVGSVIKRADVFFAMPLREGQLTSGRWREGLVADRHYRAQEALSAVLRPERPAKREIIYTAIHAVKGMLNDARIPIGYDVVAIELSHHYGLEQFPEVGCTIIECFNREYAKKVIIQLPGQWNPAHYHKKKDETFYVLHGVLEVDVEGKRKVLQPGDTPGSRGGYCTASGRKPA